MTPLTMMILASSNLSVFISINSLSTQLDASYRVTALTSQISLVNFL